MRGIALIAGSALSIFLSFSASAQPGSVSAGIRAYAQQKYVIAAELLAPPAELGNPIAETYLGFMYQDGRGVPRDYVQAARWFQAAAEQGQPTAQFFLAELYDKGLGVKTDWVQAEMWLDVATAHADAHDRDHWARMRDGVASKLTLDELAKARALATAFSPILVR